MVNTVHPQEVAKFHSHANAWWDTRGPFKTLHHINPVRLAFIKAVSDIKQKTILDVGCGGGVLAEALAKCGAKVVGIDADPLSIDIAQSHAKGQDLDLTYHATAIETFDSPLFDIVTCMEMLEHVTCPAEVIAHCAKKLRPGGYLFLSTINRTPQAYLNAVVMAEYVLKLLPRQTHDYAKFIRPSELASMVRKAGLNVIKTEGMGYSPFTQQGYLQDSVGVNYLMVCR